MKDICWEEGRVTFLDFERTARTPQTKTKMADDLALFFFSALGEPNFTDEMLNAAKQAYLEAGGAGIWDRAARKLHKLRWLPVVLSPAIALMKDNREFRALPRTFAFFEA